MEFVTPLFSVISSLCTSIVTRISYVVNLDKEVQTLAAALNELIEKRDDLRRQVEQAEIEGQACTSQVKGWLRRVEVAELESSSILEDLGQRKRGFCSVNCPSMYKKSKEVPKKLRDITELMEKGAFDVILVDGVSPVAVEEMPSRPTVGLDMMLEKIRQYLGDEEVGIIGIYGIDGVGKTTLLKDINNEFLTKIHHYDVVIWVSVSKDFVFDKMQQAIGERLGLSWKGEESLEHRASKIYKVMKRKKFLLLLDDVWEGLALEKIGIPFPQKQNKCKVIFTTRSMDVCSDMDAHRRLKVEYLSEKDSWKLFCEKVAGETKVLESESIRPHAETIVRKCGGLPLALITVGRAMANKETEEEWKNAIQVLNKSPSELRGMEDVFTLLRFSYDNLEYDTLRSCFLYCSLFPEDYSIEKEQLVEYWIGEEFLGSSNDSNVHNKGHDVIGSLKIACLLEIGEEETQVKMHDVIRSFALWIASESGSNKKFLVEASMGLNRAPRVEDWEGAQRISLLDNGIRVLIETPMCPNLSTLLLQWNSGLSKISDGFFQFMPALKVLDLSFTSLREIPVSISSLVELSHLDLSGTKLATLPKELGSLVKLKHLDLQRTYSLRKIPHEAICTLSQLQVLNFYYSCAGWEIQDCKGENEVEFADLEGLRHLKTLGTTITELTSLEKLSGYSRLLKCIQYLYINECEGLFHLELPSSSSERLRRLSLNNCYDLKYLAMGAGAGTGRLQSLEVLALHGLPNLTTVWRNPITRTCLRNLRSLNIWYCHKLKNVSWVLQLPKLEAIYLFYCNEMEEVICGDVRVLEGESNAFPCLRTFSIRELPKLRSFCLSTLAFPSLERIAVINCPKLKKLPIKAQNNWTLPTVYGAKDWWDGLEWEKAATKSAFLPHFMAT